MSAPVNVRMIIRCVTATVLYGENCSLMRADMEAANAAINELLEADTALDYCYDRLVRANAGVRASTRADDDAFRKQCSAQHAYDRAADRRRRAIINCKGESA